MEQLFGVDISSIGQGYISPENWAIINGHCNFVAMQASYGTETDEQIGHNQLQARYQKTVAGPLGIIYYHFAYPQFAVNTPQASAQRFLSAIGPLQVGESLAIDWEQPYGGDQAAWVLAFDDYIFGQTGVHLGWVYLDQSRESSVDWSPVVARGIRLWLAKYDGSKTAIVPAAHWPNVSMKQWTDADIVPGFAGKVDGDTFEGGWDALGAIGQQPPPTTTEAPTTTTTTTEAPAAPPEPGSVVQPNRVVTPEPVAGTATTTSTTTEAVAIPVRHVAPPALELGRGVFVSFLIVIFNWLRGVR